MGIRKFLAPAVLALSVVTTQPVFAQEIKAGQLDIRSKAEAACAGIEDKQDKELCEEEHTQRVLAETLERQAESHRNAAAAIKSVRQSIHDLTR